MGLSASQARLLSITSRLSDNELRTQNITTAKSALANKTSQASAEYIAALDETNMYFSTYDDSGNKISTALTGTCLTQYAPLKNQYGIVNNDGQIMVSELDANNYLESANVAEFLEKYGFENYFTQTTKTELNLGEYYNSDEYKQWQKDYSDYQKDVAEWEGREPLQKDYQKEIITTGHTLPYPDKNDFMIEDPNFVPGQPGVETWSLYDEFMNGTAGGCFTCSSNPGSIFYNEIRHYNHTLAHMLVNGYPECWCGNLWWNLPVGGINGTAGDGKIMQQIAEALVGKTCCGEKESSCNGDHPHTWYEHNVNLDCGGIACDGNELITDKIKKLMDDISAYAHTFPNPDTYGDDNDPKWIALKQRYYHLIEHDLRGILETVEIPVEIPKIFDEESYNKALEEYENSYYETVTYEPDVEAFEEAHDKWEQEGEELKEPPKPDTTPFEYTITTFDVNAESEEGQWYINLWHRMNGASIFKTTIDGVENGTHDPDNDGVIKGDNIKSPTNGLTENGKILWTVLEDGLMNSKDWLKYALENRQVSLERVNFTNPTEHGTGLEYYTWTSIIYSNALDITEEVNEKAITQAEVKYKNALSDIEAKDKNYDNILRRLDTEHNALQTEYDSIKGVIGKNIEKTLKLFS